MAALRPLNRRKRVVYTRNPLKEVIAAIRFPVVLELTREPPIALQRVLATSYPLVEVQYQQFFGPVRVGRGEADELSANTISPVSTYRFSSIDQKWHVSVEPTLLALTCRAYISWSEFRARFEAAISAMLGVYSISVVSRLGLRYIDFINRSKLGLEECAWEELVDPRVISTPTFFTDEIELDPSFEFVTSLRIPPGFVTVHVAMTQSPEREAGLLFDTDCYAEENCSASTDVLMDRSDALHEYTSTIFQACISDRLHDALV